MKLIHIINPVKVGETSDLFKAQPITFESMRIACEFATNTVEVKQFATQYEEDVDIVPGWIANAGNLHRSVLDCGSFNAKRKLPLIHDIVEKACNQANDGDYIIYTNSDIGLLPHFYNFVFEKINSGVDAMVINRRTVSESHNINDLWTLFADPGKKHPGFDCFIFKASSFKEFVLNEVCIGMSKIGITLLINLMNTSRNFQLFTDLHLTFHIGEDKVWMNPKFEDYFEHNRKHALDAYEKILAATPTLLNDQLISKHYTLLKNTNGSSTAVSKPTLGSRLKSIFKS